MSEQRTAPIGSAQHELSLWCRRPARIHVFPANGREWVLARLQGVVHAVNEAEQRLSLDLAVPFHAGWSEANLVAEILLPQGVLRFDTHALPPIEPVAYQIQVPVPTQRESVQRRNHNRVDVMLSAVVRRTAAGALVAGRILNLSAGGLGLLLPVALYPNEEIIVDFVSGDGTRYELPGSVVRMQTLPEGTLAGIQFTNVCPEVAATLSRYVSGLLASET